jgi:hypothetical protein
MPSVSIASRVRATAWPQVGISSFARDTADGRQPQIDRRWRVLALLEVDPTTEIDGAVEREARLPARVDRIMDILRNRKYDVAVANCSG